MGRPITKRPVSKARPTNRRTAFHAAQEAQAEINRAEALRLRVQGLSERSIATQLGVSQPVVHGYLKTAFAEMRAGDSEQVERLRAISHARNEALIERWLPVATSEQLVIETIEQVPGADGELRPRVIEVADYEAGKAAAAIVLKADAANRELFGLDAPKKQEVGKPGTFDTLETIRARLAERRPAVMGQN